MVGADRDSAFADAACRLPCFAEAYPALFGFGAVQPAAAGAAAGSAGWAAGAALMDVDAHAAPPNRLSAVSFGTPYTTTRCTALTMCPVMH